LLAGALVNYADDEGYFNANPVLVKAGTNPLRVDKTSIEEQMEQLARIGYIEVRRSGVKHYGKVLTFETHQRVSHATPSKLKSKFEELPKSSGEIPEPLPKSSAVKGIELKGIEQGREASTANAVAARGRLVCTLPLNQGDHEVFEAEVQEWSGLYPAVDVKQELRSIKGWAQSNPTRRKTKSGIGRFINSWLARSQNEAKPGVSNGNRNQSKTGGNLNAAEQAIAFLAKAERDREAADDVQPEAPGGGEPGDIGLVRVGSDACGTGGLGKCLEGTLSPTAP
jgi:hypothetical protein